MGAAEQQQFSQYPLRYGDGTLGAAIAQTRGGKDELVTPVALWELDDTSGLYLPPGLSQNPRRPRVDAQLSGSNVPSKLAADGLESVVFSRQGLLAAGTSETLFDRSGVRCELEALTGASPSSNFAFDIRVYKEDGTTDGLNIPGIDGLQAGLRVRPTVLQDNHDGENDFFKNSVFDTQNSRYAIIMKRQAVFGNGVVVKVVNSSEGDYNVAIVGMVYVARS